MYTKIRTQPFVVHDVSRPLYVQLRPEFQVQDRCLHDMTCAHASRTNRRVKHAATNTGRRRTRNTTSPPFRSAPNGSARSNTEQVYFKYTHAHRNPKTQRSHGARMFGINEAQTCDLTSSDLLSTTAVVVVVTVAVAVADAVPAAPTAAPPSAIPLFGALAFVLAL